MTNIILLAFLIMLPYKIEINPVSKSIAKSKKIEVCEISRRDNIEDSKTDINSKKHLINGYKIVKKYTLTNKHKNKLVKSLLSNKNYITGNSRSCPFLPTTYLIIDKNVKILLSKDPCPIMQIISNEKIIYEADLVSNNNIESQLISYSKNYH